MASATFLSPSTLALLIFSSAKVLFAWSRGDLGQVAALVSGKVHCGVVPAFAVALPIAASIWAIRRSRSATIMILTFQLGVHVGAALGNSGFDPRPGGR